MDSDGAALAIGDGGDPDAFEHRFRRTIDYGSAACLLVRADLFREVGGFDPVYTPAYYEDADLCFKLEARGFSTALEPASRVIHVRGGESRQARRLMIDEPRTLCRALERPPGAPAARSAPTRGTGGFASPHRDAEALERILVIDDRVPHHDRGSGDPRMAKMLAELVDLWPEARITLFASIPTNAERYAPPLLEQGIEVACADERFDLLVRPAPVPLLGRPRQPRVEHRALREPPPADATPGAPDLRHRGARLPPLRAARRRRRRSGCASSSSRGSTGADVVLCVSEDEAAFARERTDVPVHVLSTLRGRARPLRRLRRAGRSRLLRRLPRRARWAERGRGRPARRGRHADPLGARCPDLPLEIVGANPTPAVRELQRPLVDVVGFVPDPAERLSRCARPRPSAPLRRRDQAQAHRHDGRRSAVRDHADRCRRARPRRPRGRPRRRRPGELARARARALPRPRSSGSACRPELLELVEERFGRERFRRTLVEAFGQLGVAPPPGSAGAQRRGLRTKNAKSLGSTRSAISTSSSSDIRSRSATSFGSSSWKLAAMSASRNWSSVPPKSAR